jgi:hypothetical protein
VDQPAVALSLRQGPASDQAGRVSGHPAPTFLDAQKSGLAPHDEAIRRETITVAAGRSTDVVLQMQRGAAITGKVTDPKE